MWLGITRTRSPTLNSASALSQVDEAVLFVHFVEARSRGFHHLPEGDFGGVGQAVRGERLGAAIDDHLSRKGGGNHRGEDGGCAIFQRAGAASNRIEVVEHVGAGANLGDTVDLVGVEERGRGSAADDSDLIPAARKSSRMPRIRSESCDMARSPDSSRPLMWPG